MTAGAVTAVTALMLSLFPAAAAQAATVYELDGRWAEGTPASVGKGDVVNAEWRLNLNDDAAAPANDPVDNVTFTIALEHGLFKNVPDVCATTNVDPVSSISADGRSLICNLGTVEQGSAIAVLSPVVADGLTGDQITASAQINGQTKALDPINIVNSFGMDMHFGENTGYYLWNQTSSSVAVDLQWSLRLAIGSDPGPDQVTYRLTLGEQNGADISVGAHVRSGQVGCSPFEFYTAQGHPWSELPGYPIDRQAPFVDSCTLTEVSPGQFDLTLTGIDYDLVQVPTNDSAGRPLPTDWNYIASGSIWLNVATTQAGSVSLSSSTPTYTSTTGLQSTDLPGNNTTSKAYTLPGSFSAGWDRGWTGSGGTAWDDSYRVSAGTEIRQVVTNAYGNEASAPGATYGNCLALDNRFVTFIPGGVVAWATDSVLGQGKVFNPATLEYYVGGNALLDPNSALYNPDAFDCGVADGGWTAAEPSDPGAVKAVRISYPFSTFVTEDRDYLQLYVRTMVDATVPTGQDVWTFGSALHAGGWVGPGPHQPITTTADARYPNTNGRRDIVRVIYAVPAIRKSVDRSIVRPGEPATFTLSYSANGSGVVPDAVDDYRIVDTLPVGMTYTSGSASPEPVVTTNGSGQQVLTWDLDGVATNVIHSLTYQAAAADSVQPGQVLTNTATSTLAGETSLPSSAQVTVSTSGSTVLGKTTDQWFIANPDGDGSGEEGSWTVTLRSNDPLPQEFTDTIDVLPYNGDGRGTDYTGTYELSSVDVPAGATVYYTDADAGSVSDDPGAAVNGAAGSPSAMWTTVKPEAPTAVRVVGGELSPGAVFAFTVNITPDGAEPGDVWVNRAQARAEHTELVMRTSEPLTMGTAYSASLKKYVQDAEGEWRDANDVADYPSFRPGDTIRYRVVVENTGQGTIQNLEVSDDRQPELGAFVVDQLAPGDTEAHEYEIVADETLPQTLVNTACASADQPSDSEDPVSINCDPAGVELVGTPTHVKELISATPIGGGQWEVVFGIDVTNNNVYPTAYDLDDTLHFTDQAEIASAAVTVYPDGVTPSTPAWDGRGDVRIASEVALAGSGEAGYAPHHYEVTVIADVPLELEGAGTGENDPTRCGPDGDDADRAFNNTSALTDPTGAIEEDQACAELPSIEIDKSVASGPVKGADGRWSVVYDIVATNSGGAAADYDLYDKLLFGKGIQIVSAEVVAAPDGVTPQAGWSGQGADKQATENLVAEDVSLASDTVHAYRVEVVVASGTEKLSLDVLRCGPAGSGQTGGLSNSVTLSHNGNTAEDDVCPTLPIPGLAATGGDLSWWTVATGLILLLAGGGFLLIRRRRGRDDSELADVGIR